MKINIIYSSKSLKIFFILLFFIIFLALLVLGNSHQSAHQGENVAVIFGGTTMSLQEAITAGKFNGIAGTHGADQAGNACRFCKTCGGEYAKETGYLGHKSWGYNVNCGGGGQTERNAVYLCCK